MATKNASKILQPGGNIMRYMTELNALYGRLESTGEAVSDRSKIAKLMKSLPEEYKSLWVAFRIQLNNKRIWNHAQDLMQDEHEQFEQKK